MPTEQETDEDPQRLTTKQLIKESVEEDGYLKTGIMLGSLGSIAVIMLGPEYLRMGACRLLGKEYKPPTHRMVEDIEGLEPRD